MALTQIFGRQIAALDLTTEVTGVLPVANGGTGSSTATPMTTSTDQTITGIKTFNTGKLIMTSTQGTGEPYSDANPPQTLNFTDQATAPSNPPTGQSTLYTTAGRNLTLRDTDGTEVSFVRGGVAVTVSTTAPASPATNDLWIDTN